MTGQAQAWFFPPPPLGSVLTTTHVACSFARRRSSGRSPCQHGLLETSSLDNTRSHGSRKRISAEFRPKRMSVLVSQLGLLLVRAETVSCVADYHFRRSLNLLSRVCDLRSVLTSLFTLYFRIRQSFIYPKENSFARYCFGLKEK